MEQTVIKVCQMTDALCDFSIASFSMNLIAHRSTPELERCMMTQKNAQSSMNAVLGNTEKKGAGEMLVLDGVCMQGASVFLDNNHQ